MKRFIFAMVLAAAGCKTSTAEKVSQLQDSVEAYNHAYRWKNYERAATFRPADIRPAFIAAYEDDEKSLHVEEYRILKVDFENEDSAAVTVRMSYTLLPDITVQRRTLTQHWHKLDGQWILEIEDDSIRDIDIAAIPKNPRASGKAGSNDPDPNTEIEVTGPDGDIIRQDGEPLVPPSDD